MGKNIKKTEIVPEFSHVISVARIPLKGIEEHLEAKPAERAALAKRFGLVDLPVLKAQIAMTPGSRQSVAITGTIEAEVIQSCVVTLEPIRSFLKQDIDVVCTPMELPAPDPKTPLEIEIDDEFEYYSDGKIDLGELIAQYLGVSIDPYPRKAGAALRITEFGKKSEKSRPFAKLAFSIKHKKNKKKR